jgi:hypothetical protein
MRSLLRWPRRRHVGRDKHDQPHFDSDGCCDCECGTCIATPAPPSVLGVRCVCPDCVGRPVCVIHGTRDA